MKVRDCFVKVILEESSDKILGAHIIGPQAPLLIQEIITLMYTKDQSPIPLVNGMHIHPSLSEVVEQAFFNLMMHRDYQHLLSHMAPELFPSS
jgi:dihydrolipoamide dehydrogenase